MDYSTLKKFLSGDKISTATHKEILSRIQDSLIEFSRYLRDFIDNKISGKELKSIYNHLVDERNVALVSLASIASTKEVSSEFVLALGLYTDSKIDRGRYSSLIGDKELQANATKLLQVIEQIDWSHYASDPENSINNLTEIFNEWKSIYHTPTKEIDDEVSH